MSAAEKEDVLQDWKQFITAGFKYQHFTKALYHHLIMNCCFIAHCSREGFYEFYFKNPERTIKFFRQFDIVYGYRSVEMGYCCCWLDGDHADINKAMCNFWGKHKNEGYEKIYNEIRERELAQAYSLFRKHGVELR